LIIHFNYDEWETETTFTVCPYHQKNGSDVSYAGCSCTSSSLRRPKPKEKRFPTSPNGESDR